MATVSWVCQIARWWCTFWIVCHWPLEWARTQSFNQIPLGWSYFRAASSSLPGNSLWHIYALLVQNLSYCALIVPPKVMVITSLLDFCCWDKSTAWMFAAEVLMRDNLWVHVTWTIKKKKNYRFIEFQNILESDGFCFLNYIFKIYSKSPGPSARKGEY